MRRLFCYYGGKDLLRKRIVELMPPHKVYIEPFCGSAAVFFEKTPSKVEVLNDHNKLIINFFDVVRNHGDELTRRLKLTPYSREEYNRAHKILEDESDPIEMARAFFIRANQSMFGKLTNSGWIVDTTGGRNMITAWESYIERIPLAIERLKMASLECRSALEVIDLWDSPQSLCYLDPPYVGTEQGHYKGFTQADLDIFIAKIEDGKGSFILSGYENPAYPKSWERHEIETTTRIGHSRNTGTKEGCKRKELIFVVNRSSSKHPTLF